MLSLWRDGCVIYMSLLLLPVSSVLCWGARRRIREQVLLLLWLMEWIYSCSSIDMTKPFALLVVVVVVVVLL